MFQFLKKKAPAPAPAVPRLKLRHLAYSFLLGIVCTIVVGMFIAYQCFMAPDRIWALTDLGTGKYEIIAYGQKGSQHFITVRDPKLNRIFPIVLPTKTVQTQGAHPDTLVVEKTGGYSILGGFKTACLVQRNESIEVADGSLHAVGDE